MALMTCDLFLLFSSYILRPTKGERVNFRDLEGDKTHVSHVKPRFSFSAGSLLLATCLDSTRRETSVAAPIKLLTARGTTTLLSCRRHDGGRLPRVRARSVAVHPRVLGANLAVQGRRERPACGREHHQHCVSQSTVKVGRELRVSFTGAVRGTLSWRSRPRATVICQ